MDEYLRGVIHTQTEAAAVDVQQARRAVLHNLEPATGTNTNLSHSANESGFTSNFGDVSPFAGLEKIQRKCVSHHGKDQAGGR
jgi:hypothetical protein